MSPTGFTRLIVEKPFGNDYKSAEVLGAGLKEIFDEENIYRCIYTKSLPHVRARKNVRDAVSWKLRTWQYSMDTLSILDH